MIVFYCDLDNTLIYSQRRAIGPDRVGVEQYRGEEISFMTTASLDMLDKVRKTVLFVPTTARTPEQYARVRLGAPPDFALVCNGGMLLRHGQIDEAWYAQTRAQIAPSRAELDRAAILLEKDPDRCFDMRDLHELFLFSKSSDPAATEKRLRAALDPTQVSVFSQGAKMYVMPKLLTKAHATERLNRLLGQTYTLAAGDSTMDAGMLLAADRAFAPQTLADMLPQQENLVAIPEGRVFSDAFLGMILEAHGNRAAR